MEFSKEQRQTRFLAVLLPVLTLSTHLLLCTSFALPDNDPTRAFWSFVYNVLAASASILGLIGAVRFIPRLVSAYIFFHTTTLSFVTLALVNIIIPFDFQLLNPMLPRQQVDAVSLCRDLDAGLGWDDEWLTKCSTTFHLVKLCVAWGGLFLMTAQFWALITVRNWGQEVRRQQMSGNTDVEKAGLMDERCESMNDEKIWS
ncbi:hypothetical protein P153DRAFT_323159 [Dothidotthia symphoricarpi CBS 119687]|uniref:Uncharacterized protein n=1 Tax=Dothidotthia symphoricarpi CBS 119687 TaxID=1392245 RepID=A0A6A6A293_9PLEO|nr:uncharacterized protein P153DRAFT_323159 [Dothidotthia symphoricarpi CBS 119687]KAF2126112.1 hypothetical protein P153DRAFT_323159 [Dothidotthia symphoricarpi CBS 119687]